MRERGETFRFCANCLSPEIVAGIQYSGAQAEAHAPAKWRDKILRAQPTVGEDVPVGLGAVERYEKPAEFSVSLHCKHSSDDHLRTRRGGLRMRRAFWQARTAPGAARPLPAHGSARTNEYCQFRFARGRESSVLTLQPGRRQRWIRPSFFGMKS